MSITSSFQVDNSAALAKEFAVMTAAYIDNPPDTAEDPAALVPLENVFRILEMFRYDAYRDEDRGGVLAMESPDQIYKMAFRPKPWHEQIASALQHALVQAYGAAGKEQAIDELQTGLRELLRHKAVDQQVAGRAKMFLTAFSAQLA